MLAARPLYFDSVQAKASKRWNQLEEDPELAGPWHQLFRQVQSPRHVLSELLQNADDAQAKGASVRIQDGVFVFEHDGGDFTEEHFGSLCRFGYSSKRSLHTIGFRGIGFKSTFSLGDDVFLSSPTLSVRFSRKRFTEPHWIPEAADNEGKTSVRVSISDVHRQREIEGNLAEWIDSPISLLFFKNLRRITIGDRTIHWGSLGPGPVPNSEWMAMYGDEDNAVLVVRSEAEPFPEEALAEIREERTLSSDEQAEFPASKIELVLGVEGRLFVVLPTGVKTQLPFACNAPFIAKPDRNDIKDPAISHTNRWLLERAGRLAASTMLAWLAQGAITPAERSGAYRLMPDVDREDSSLSGVCGTIVEETFSDSIDDEAILLTEEGGVVLADEAVIVPQTIIDVWSASQAAEFLDDDHRLTLSPHVSLDDRTKLKRWNLVREIDKSAILKILKQRHLPKPASWRQLMMLWGYIAPEVTSYYFTGAEDLRIVPVQGQDVLCAGAEVVRLGEKKLLQSDGDWQFLSGHLTALNQNWTRFLADQRRLANDGDDEALQEVVNAAYAVLEETGLDATSNADAVVSRVAASFFALDQVELTDCVRLAHIAAKLGAAVDDEFHFATRDRTLREASSQIFVDEDGWLQDLIPDDLWESSLLHQDYTASFTSCSREDWSRWVSQGSSTLLTFVPLEAVRQSIYGRKNIEREAQKRGFAAPISYPYVTSSFAIEDWDFPAVYWTHWEGQAASDPKVWVRVAEKLLSQGESYWSGARSARIKQIATTGRGASIVPNQLLPTWVLRLRGLACLPDTHQIPHKPSDLMRRTHETESLIDIEPFIYGLLDREPMQPLLDLLGVRSTPLGPASLLARLRVFAKVDRPPITEVERCYRRIDQMAETASTANLQLIKDAFQSERLILTEDGTWSSAGSAFIQSDEDDVPGAAVVRASVADLSLWTRVGVQQRPTAELAMIWLKKLSPGQLASEDLRRVRALLPRYPQHIWNECGHWLNLAGEWVPTSSLEYALSMQSLIAWSHLHLWVKQQTADMTKLSMVTTGDTPFSEIPALAAHVSERFHQAPNDGKLMKKDWLTALGVDLSRAELESDDETNRVRAIAARLAETRWQVSPQLEVIPYLGGVPAGLPRRSDVLWVDRVLYADDLPNGKLAKRVPEEIGRQFARPDVKAALDYGFDRSPEAVRDYLEENFTLAELAQADLGTEEATSQDQLAADPSPDPKGTEPQGASAHEDDIEDAEEHDSEQQPAPAEPKPPSRQPAPPTPKRPEIMERFAKSRGYKKDDDDRYFHSDGSWIARERDSRFPWASHNPSGEVIRYYWPKDHCLERDPLQLEADIWGLIDHHPDTYALILSDQDGAVLEVTGGHLRSLKDRGNIKLYPATYRIVYEHDQPN
ncbi:sacsin N-terminal ATP-binding-like domain-containing protein [Roseovarius sp.]|uniref:sacsin N-terminal ATP-binding-like domain-containing protein n=1 Tax=Roseovarius sp. TaxID=1486281 RepID=UPI003A96E8EF